MLPKLTPIPWTILTLAIGTLGFAAEQAIVQGLTCGENVPANSLLPWWVHTVLFVGFCVGRASVWLPISVALVLLRTDVKPTQMAFSLSAVFVWMVLIHIVELPGGDPYQVLNLADAAFTSFWITLPVAATFALLRHFSADNEQCTQSRST